jgi:hypothetical protein
MQKRYSPTGSRTVTVLDHPHFFILSDAHYLGVISFFSGKKFILVLMATQYP